MLRAIVLLMASTSVLIAQIDAGTELWVRVRQHSRENVAGLPNYTCQETMERSIRNPQGRVDFRERLRLEVLFANKTELFAWPGSSAFTPEPLENWIRAGAIANGSFAADTYNLFVSSNASITYVGLENKKGRLLHRFNFFVPLLSSRHELSVNGISATTAYSGAVWADPDSLDVVQLDSRAEQIPSNLDCSEASQSVTYGRIRLGLTDRLIPSATELLIVRRGGIQSRSAVAFSKCGHYGATSSLSFNIPMENPIARIDTPRDLPAARTLVLRLEQPIVIEEAAAGDQIWARLEKSVKSGPYNLPKGTRVLGRIQRLEQFLNKPSSMRIGLQFHELESRNGPIRFSAVLIGPKLTSATFATHTLGAGGPEIVTGATGLDIEDEGSSTGVGVFRVPGKHTRLWLPHTIWRTR